MKNKLARRSRRRWLSAGVVLWTALLVGPWGGAAADDAGGTGTVTAIQGFPNFAAAFDVPPPDPNRVQALPSTQTYVLTDDVNHLAFEWIANGANHPCGGAMIVKYDLDTGRRLGYSCTFYYPADGNTEAYQSSLTDWAVVDPAANVIVFPTPQGNAIATTSLVAISETTLQQVANICVAPPGVSDAGTGLMGGCQAAQVPDPNAVSQPLYPFVHGVSFDPDTGDLVVQTDPQNSAGVNLYPPAGVGIADYRLSGSDAHVAFALRWVFDLPPSICQESLLQPGGGSSAWSIAAPYLNTQEPALFVPCSTTGYQNSFPSASSVVKVALQHTCLCPSASPTESSVVAPAPTDAFLFDPVGERGYFLPQAGTANGYGATVLVYDGKGPGSMIGRFDVADQPTTSLSPYFFALDPHTGRFYAEDVHHGLRVVDGRRSPLNPGELFPIIQGAALISANVVFMDVVGPDAAYPYPRLIMPLTNATFGASPRVLTFTVVADRLPVTADPPKAAIDDLTFNGTIPQGSDVSMTYGVHAAGYGAHSDLVGGYSGVYFNNNPAANNIPKPNLPYGNKTLDLAFGAVESTSLQDGTAAASASAFADVNGQAGKLYNACSDRFSPQSCTFPQCYINLNSIFTNGVPPPLPSSLDPCTSLHQAFVQQTQPGGPPPTSSAQQWPYPMAQCSQPGGTAKDEEDGLRWFPEHSTDPKVTPPPEQDFLNAGSSLLGAPQSPVTSSFASGARTWAKCGGSVSAFGRYSCTAAPSAEPDPTNETCEQPSTITIAGAQTTTGLTPPGADGKASSTVTAVASGIHLVLPDNAVLDIGQVIQTVTVWAGGHTGTAGTHRTVVFHDVSFVAPLNGTHTHICAGSGCTLGVDTSTDQPLLDALNGLDPSHFTVSFPAPDESFGVGPDGLSPSGSPGGYEASVQANSIEEVGDRQFNQMTGFANAESRLLPALRLVLYNPGNAQVNREIFDVAGVEADAHVGVDVQTPFTDNGGPGGGPVVDLTQAAIAAGLAPMIDTGNSNPLPGPPRTVVRSTGLLGVIERTLDGLGWLVRSPIGGVQMAAFLMLLGLPLALSRRRWGWRTTLTEKGRSR